MSSQPQDRITELLHAWRSGDMTARDELMAVIHNELHRLARGYMRRERPGHTLQTTALINEAYLRLMGRRARTGNPGAFFRPRCAVHAPHPRGPRASAAVSQAPTTRRRIRAARRSGGLRTKRAPALIALDEALERLAALDQRKARVVELRYFAGLTVEEAADLLEGSPVTVMRDWSLAKAWLQRELRGGS